MNKDSLFKAKYHIENYNCAHFVCDAYELATGSSIREQMQGFLLPMRNVPVSTKAVLKRLDSPENNCLVWMRDSHKNPHVGIMLNGKVLHLTESKGVQYVKLEVVASEYKTIRFYKCLTQ